jgi:putative peptide zinc metalloprotease protein
MINFGAVREIEINDFDASYNEKRFVVCYKNKHFDVGESVIQLIEVLKQSDSVESARIRFSEQRGKNLSQEQMEAIINYCIVPILESEKQPSPKPFLVKLDLVSANMVAKVSHILKFLFKPLIAGILLAIIVILHISFYISVNTVFVFGQLDILALLGILGLFILSSCFHELGHAASCQYYGVGHGGVGFGLYLNFPVLYTDVSNVWKLSRKKRLVVNVAGVYFQLIFLIPLLIIYLFFPNSFLKYFIMTVNINFLITLNPFFKFDGYWIISDLLGVPNLRSRTNEVFKYFFSKIRRKPIIRKPFLFTMQPGEKIFMAIYTLIMNLFFVFVFAYAMPKFIYHFFSTFPDQAKELVLQIALGDIPSFGLIRQLFAQILFFGFTLYAIYRVTKPIAFRWLNKKK